MACIANGVPDVNTCLDCMSMHGLISWFVFMHVSIMIVGGHLYSPMHDVGLVQEFEMYKLGRGRDDRQGPPQCHV